MIFDLKSINRRLHQRIAEHKYFAVGQHIAKNHKNSYEDAEKNFSILMKCQSKSDCLLYKMLFIRDLNPSLNIQGDSVKSKLFIYCFFKILLEHLGYHTIFK